MCVPITLCNLSPIKIQSSSMSSRCMDMRMPSRCHGHSGVSWAKLTPYPMGVWPAWQITVFLRGNQRFLHGAGHYSGKGSTGPGYFSQMGGCLLWGRRASSNRHNKPCATGYSTTRPRCRRIWPGKQPRSCMSAQYAFTWWDWVFRGCTIGSALIFAFTLVQTVVYRRCL